MPLTTSYRGLRFSARTAHCPPAFRTARSRTVGCALSMAYRARTSAPSAPPHVTASKFPSTAAVRPVMGLYCCKSQVMPAAGTPSDPCIKTRAPIATKAQATEAVMSRGWGCFMTNNSQKMGNRRSHETRSRTTGWPPSTHSARAKSALLKREADAQACDACRDDAAGVAE